MNAFNFPVQAPRPSLQSDAKEPSLHLRELRYFHSVARTGNFGRSARELNISQPAVSQQIRKLEDGLGTQLLVRHGRGVMLTPAGVGLRDRLDTIMQLLAAPLTDDAVAGPEAWAVSLAVPAETGPLLVAPIVRRFRARWPAVALEIREGSGADIEEWLLHHRVNVAVMQDPPNLPELDVTPIVSEGLGLVAPVRSRAADDSQPLRLRDLVDEPLILPGTRHWIRRRLDNAARQHGLRLQPLLQVNSVASTKVMVRNGIGSTILPLISVQDEVARGVLVFRPISCPELRSICAIASRRGMVPSVVGEFTKIAQEAMTTLVERGVWPGVQVIKCARKPDASAT
jgi:LysR family transcriptional regulator, nitrogen assimilation regulatory protein